MVFGTLLVLFVLVFAGRLFGGMMAERRYVRKHGVSLDTPVCAACEYTAVGWTSRFCPECGADASVTGLRIGPRRKTVRLDAWLMAIFLALVMPAVITGMNWLSQAETRSGSITLNFSSIPALQLVYTYEVTEVRILPLDSAEAWVQLMRTDTGAMSPRFSRDDLDEDGLSASISNLVDIGTELRDATVVDIQSMLSTSTMTSDTSTWRIPPSMSVANGGYTIQPSAWRVLSMLGTIAICLPLGVLVINRILKRVKDGFEFPNHDSPRWTASKST